MKRRRAVIALEVDLDPVYGWGSEAEDYAKALRHWAQSSIPHYNPVVTVIAVDGEPGGGS